MSNIRRKASEYPEVITQLPEADIQFKGARAWILQSDAEQLVFFEFEAGTDVPEHSHSYPQWGMLIDGKMELTVNETPRICEKGDEYIIPAGSKHRASFLCKSRVLDFFSERSRYQPKARL